MTNNDELERERLEAWAVTVFDTRLLKGLNGDHLGSHLSVMWQAWQASRERIEVQPPKFIESHEALNKGFTVDYSNGFGDAMDAYELSLTKAGIKVKS